MSVELLTEHHLEFLSLKGGGTGLSESTLVKMPHCWKLRVAAHRKKLVKSSFHFFATQGGGEQNAVKPVLSGHSKRSPKLYFKADYRSMQVKSVAECSLGAFCNTFDLHSATIFLEDLHFVYF